MCPLERAPCPNCNSPIPQDFALCPRCNCDPSELEEIKARQEAGEAKRRRLESLNIWAEWIIALCLGLGLFAHYLAFLDYSFPGSLACGPWFILGGSAFMCQAAMVGAKMKNRHRAWGLLGLLSLPGVLVVYLIRRRCWTCSTLHNAFRPGCPRCESQ